MSGASAAVSGVVITLDEEQRIGACLEALSFCDELVVVDSGSTDKTVVIAKEHGARVMVRPFTGMNDQKDFARASCKGPWVLNVDADEIVSKELGTEITELLAGNSAEQHAGYSIAFRNHFAGRFVRGCGYYPDRHIRLVHKERGRWDDTAKAHDLVRLNGSQGKLRNHIEHYSFDSVQDFLRKSERYAAAFAETAWDNGRRSGPATMLGHSSWRFFRSLVLQGGFRDGALGVVISGLQAYEVFQKYARLWERQIAERG